MKLSRRSFMKANAVAAAAAAAGLSVPGVARAVVGQQEAIKWDKAPCRFCGTGCGVLALKATSCPKSCTVKIV